MEIKKVIIPAAGLGTRFLPLTKVVAKELLPLVGEPMISWIVKEARDSGIKQIVFVLAESKKNILNYFKKNSKLESILKKRNQKKISKTLEKNDGEFEDMSFSVVIQPSPRGDGDAILRAKKLIKKEPFGVLFADDVLISRVPVLEQVLKIFKTSQKPVIGLKKVPKERLPFYGVVGVEKIASRLYKIKEITEKPDVPEAPSDLAIVGRYVLPPEIFNYLEKTSPNKKGEIILAEALKLMLKDGKIVYGYEFEGEWLECGNIEEWMKSNMYLSLKHPQYGPILKQYLK